MQTLTIQLSFNFELSEDSLFDAIEFLEFIVENGQALASLRTYNQIFYSIHFCHKNGILSTAAFSRLNCRLVSSHDRVLFLNGVR